MDYQTEQGSSAKWYIAGVIVLVGLALWYFYGRQAPETNLDSTAQTPAAAVVGTTAEITAEFEQLPDNSAALDLDAASSEAEVKSL